MVTFKQKQRLYSLLAIMTLAAVHNTARSQIYLFPPKADNLLSSQQLPIKNYTQTLDNITSGQTLAFSDGSLFEYIEPIGQGATCRILKVKALTGDHKNTEMALRIPIKSAYLIYAQNWEVEPMDMFTNNPAHKYTFSYYIDDAIKYADLFAAAGIGPTYYQSLAGQYVASEIINRKFSLDEYIDGKIRLTTSEDQQVKHHLTNFIHKTAGIISIKDIAQPGQVLYDGTRFVLVDRFQVNFVNDTMYPWGFLGPTGESIVEAIIYQRSDHAEEHAPTEIRTLVEQEWKEARLNMLDTGYNPLTLQPITVNHNIFTRYLGSWRKIYQELSKTRKSRTCNAKLRGPIFPSNFNPAKYLNYKDL